MAMNCGNCKTREVTSDGHNELIHSDDWRYMCDPKGTNYAVQKQGGRRPQSTEAKTYQGADGSGQKKGNKRP